MGDMSEIYQAMKEHKKDRKAERLSKANPEGWTIHTPYHWSRMVDYSNTKKKLNYWPSTGLCMLNGKRRNINSKFIQEKLKAV